MPAPWIAKPDQLGIGAGAPAFLAPQQRQHVFHGIEIAIAAEHLRDGQRCSTPAVLADRYPHEARPLSPQGAQSGDSVGVATAHAARIA